MGFSSLRSLIALWLLGLSLAWPGWTLADTPWVQPDAEGRPQLQVYFFWSLKCPHCLDARPHIEALPQAVPGIRLHSLELTRQREHARLYIEMAEGLGQRAEAVPAILFCGEMHVGWDSPESTGAFLIQRLKACQERVAAGLPAADTDQGAMPELPLIGALDLEALSLPALTLAIAGMDAFNPCAFFVLLFLLSLLVHQQRRSRMLLIGGIFVFFSGLMYFAFMAAWLNLFKVMSGLTWVTAGAGVLAVLIGIVNVKDFFAFKKGVSLSIPDSRKADIYRRGRAILAAGNLPTMLVATVALAVAANFYELLCTAGFPMVYTRLLTLHELPAGAHYLYLALYNAVYVVPLLLIVTAFALSMGGRKLTERQGRLLKLLSGLMMLGLGLLLVIAPERLNSLATALVLLGAALMLTWVAARMTRSSQN
jgi:hypothetical protein